MWRPHSSPPARWLLPLLLAACAAVEAEPTGAADKAGARGLVVTATQAEPAATSGGPVHSAWGTGFERRQVLRPTALPIEPGPQFPARVGDRGCWGAGQGRGRGR